MATVQIWHRNPDNYRVGRDLGVRAVRLDTGAAIIADDSELIVRIRLSETEVRAIIRGLTRGPSVPTFVE